MTTCLLNTEAEIRRAKTLGDDDLLEQVENHFSSAFQYHFEQGEIERSRYLERNAYRVGAYFPPRPKYSNEEWEKSDYWEKGDYGWYLTAKGRDTIRDNIEKVKKWKRERIQFIIQCLKAIVTFIGAIGGWIAFYLK
jgi:hypothetical protein